MLLFLEISLTIAAWKNGWRGRALLPLAGAFLVAFLLGGALGSSGGSDADARVLGFLCDLGAVIVLGVMAKRAPSSAVAPVSLCRSEGSDRLTDCSPVSGD
jgi:hypothetical protein